MQRFLWCTWQTYYVLLWPPCSKCSLVTCCTYIPTLTKSLIRHRNPNTWYDHLIALACSLHMTSIKRDEKIHKVLFLLSYLHPFISHMDVDRYITAWCWSSLLSLSRILPSCATVSCSSVDFSHRLFRRLVKFWWIFKLLSLLLCLWQLKHVLFSCSSKNVTWLGVFLWYAENESFRHAFGNSFGAWVNFQNYPLTWLMLWYTGRKSSTTRKRERS